jgi:hypothetical protein
VSEQDERVTVRGPRGERGKRGEPGMGRKGRRGVVTLFALAAGLTAVNLLFSAVDVNTTRAEILAQGHAAHVARVREEDALTARLCMTFAALAALKPPPGPAAANPSRAYEQRLNAVLNHFGVDLECGQAPAAPVRVTVPEEITRAEVARGVS